MAGMQGRRITVAQIDRVKCLLAETEMTAHEIARRTGTSPVTIISINRHSGTRRINGRRSLWEKSSEAGAIAAKLRQ